MKLSHTAAISERSKHDPPPPASDHSDLAALEASELRLSTRSELLRVPSGRGLSGDTNGPASGPTSPAPPEAAPRSELGWDTACCDWATYRTAGGKGKAGGSR